MENKTNNLTASRIDDFTLSVTSTPIPPIPPTPIPTTNTYTRTFLEQQAKDIQTQWDSQVAELNKQIDTVNASQKANLDQVSNLLTLCDTNNIIVKPEPVTMPIEPTPVEVVPLDAMPLPVDKIITP